MATQNLKRGIRKLGPGKWGVVVVKQHGDRKLSERLLDECAGIGAKREAILRAGTNEVV